MATQIISENLVKFFSALLECCCDTVITPMCDDNVSQLEDRVKTERIPRGSDLSDKKVFVWMKKLANLKKHSEALLRRTGTRAGWCGFVFVAYDNFEAAKYLKLWDKLDEEEPVPASVPAAPADSTGSTHHELTHESTAPVGAMDVQLAVFSGGNNEVNYDGLANRKKPWVLDSLGFLEGNNQFARDLVSTAKKVAGDVDGAVVQSMHGTRLIRSRSFEIIHEERVLIFDKRSLVNNYHEHY